jgi:hypothetical protein
MHIPAGNATSCSLRGHVHSVAKQISSRDDDIAEIETEAELHAAIGRQVSVAAMEGALDRDGGTHALHGALKFGHDAIAGAAENTSTVLRDQVSDGGVL